jgi:predicted dienelactone hydrolase
MNNNNSDVFAGSKQIQVKDETNGISFSVLVHYPTHQPSSPTNFGPYTLDVCVDAKIIAGQFPLVVVSHGRSAANGSSFRFRTISTFLAKSGYIVACIEHYGNDHPDKNFQTSIENLSYRPKHISLTIDNLLSDQTFGQSILFDKIAILGHSLGGYAALAVAGGKPWAQTGQPIEVQNDPRIKALILMAPAAAFFIPEHALYKVDIPMLLLIAEQDEITPLKWTADVILNGVPDKSKVTLKTISNAGHFSFISPFPAAMKKPNFRPATDPEGFDREEFHKILPTEVLNFLNEKLLCIN